MRSIELKNARTHNLKGIDLSVPPGSLVVVTGPSGSGKSSLAFSTLYAEGQRRYVESFSPYARQFLERQERPPVDRLDPVPAAIAVDRRAQIKTSRSTVGTLTELSDYVRPLWAQLSTTTCPTCGTPIRARSPDDVARAVLEQSEGQRVVVTYGEQVTGPEHYLTVRDRLIQDGYRRLWIDGQARDLDDIAPSEALGIPETALGHNATGNHHPPGADTGMARPQIEVVVDRLKAAEPSRSRLVEAVEQAFGRSAHGHVCVHRPDTPTKATPNAPTLQYSNALSCDRCDYQARPPSPRLFSFNSPVGACATCKGFGKAMQVDWDKVMPDLQKTLARGGIKVWTGKFSAQERRALKRHCANVGIATDQPLASLSEDQRQSLIDGDGGNWKSGYPGLAAWFAWLETKSYKMHVRVLLARYRKYVPCPDCGGTRFKPESLVHRVQDKTIADFLALPAAQALRFIDNLGKRPEAQHKATQRVISECHRRLSTLCEVGLSYVSLDRSARSLSGGELQRVGLTSALGACLSGTLFVLDEPTVGLHPADVRKLVPVVQRLASRDNVVLVVESDAAFIDRAQRVIELGPAAGERGGQIVFDGSPQDLRAAETATARALSAGPYAQRRAAPARGWLRLSGATGHNLQSAHLQLPLGRLTCVTGVSGSGKSSLVVRTLVPAVERAKGSAHAHALPHSALTGAEHIDHVVVVDQAPLSRSSRGNAATYLGIWDAVRKVFSAADLAKDRGYKPGFFSFNITGGRCESCKGEGAETVEMQFMADVRLSCADCAGRRFSGPVLDVRIEGLSIADVLELTAKRAHDLFTGRKEIQKTLAPLLDVGLGYLPLGQPLSTLSGGEGQRLRLAAALAKRRGNSLIVLDEPSAGLHSGDLAALTSTLQALVAQGDTVVLIEHDMRLAAQADHVIDIGPGGGTGGGHIVAQGTPAEVCACPNSTTATFLAQAVTGRPTATASGLLPKAIGKSESATAQNASSPTDSATSGNPTSVVQVRGAREHNLQDIQVDIPRHRLVVVTGPSGSGKSTLAFDVIFAESQRRYLETLSPYVRQYLRQLPRPDVDEVTGMPPGISLEQRSYSGARNSTVGTVTEVAHYLRIAFARAGTLHCPDCDLPIAPRSAPALAADLRRRFSSRTISLHAPILSGKRGAHRDRLNALRTAGYTSAIIDGQPCVLTPGLSLDRYKAHDVSVTTATLAADDQTLTQALCSALLLGDGFVTVSDGEVELALSEKRACGSCGRGFPELDPRIFSFNTKQGACPTCEGKGDVEVTANKRAKTFATKTCPQCQGGRLAGLALHTRLDGHTLGELTALSVEDAITTLQRTRLENRQAAIATAPIEEATARLTTLQTLGLGYLSLDRGADTLSGGEMQRVRLSAQLGSGLTGLLYVLDEPTIGLHPRDTGRLIAALRALVGRGCSVLVVEHDGDVIQAADHMLDVGPSGGRGGGRIVAQGKPAELLADPASVTGRALARPPATRATRPVHLPPSRTDVHAGRDHGCIQLSEPRAHNLVGDDLIVPLGRLTCITGVSGSGKSTLIRELFLPAVRQHLGLTSTGKGQFKQLVIAPGEHAVCRAVEIDQSPIGRTPRSVPATYTGIWDPIRKILASTPEARAKGFTPARFSFNTTAGRCPACDGQGATSVEMAFLPQALVPCETCLGLRFDDSTLSIRYRGLSAGQILQLDVGQAAELFAAFRKVHRPLSLLCELGLSYLQLGQPSNTLSGGEAQRLKLVAELASTERSGTLYVMDEPTTGLHRDDVTRLNGVIQQLVDRGDTVVVIEHHTDLMMEADWVIDLGPEGGTSGGRIIAQGTPQQLIANPGISHTAQALRTMHA